MKELANRRSDEYAQALKEALVIRRTGSLSHDLDDMLGVIAVSITKWSLLDKVKSGSMTTAQLDDYDFFSTCVCSVVTYYDKVDLSRRPKEILIYLKRVAASAARDQILKENTAKRKHDECDAEGIIQTADIFGNSLGTLAYDYDTPKLN